MLENLFFIWKWNKDSRIKKSIERGTEFFVDNFITNKFSVSCYLTYPYPTGIQVDIRGCAEAIYCCARLSDILPECLDLAIKIAEWTIDNMQDGHGYYYLGTKAINDTEG